MNSTSYSSQKGYEPEATLLNLQFSPAVLQRFVVQSNNLFFPDYCHLELPL